MASQTLKSKEHVGQRKVSYELEKNLQDQPID